MPRTPLAVISLAAIAVAQSTAPSPEEQLRAKLESPFLRRAAWTTDWDAARERAAASGRLIFGYFTTAGY